MPESVATPVANATPATSTAPVTAPAGAPAVGDAKAPEGTPAAETARLEGTKPVEKRKFKIGGKERELTFDEALQLASKAEGAESKFEEAARMRREYEESLKQDPREILKKAGKDPVELAQQWLEEAIAEAEMSPEARELKEMREWKAQKEAEENRSKEEQVKVQKAAQLEQTTQAAIQAIDKVAKEVGLPATPAVRRRMAMYAEAMVQKQGRLDLSEVAKLVAQEQKGDVFQVFDGWSDEAVLNEMGMDRARRIAKLVAAKYRSNTAPKPTEIVTTPGDAPKYNQPKIFNEFSPDWKLT